jgi:succinate-semialdehyde dehydrogenase/glutarate-semialdehyde dehydrogenase
MTQDSLHAATPVGAMIPQTANTGWVARLRCPELLRQAAFLGGRWEAGCATARRIVRDPATGADLGVVPQCTADEVRQTIEAAHHAFRSWRALPAQERGRILRRWYDNLQIHAEDLALLMTAEQGKPLTESRAEIAYAASFVEWYAEEARRVYGEIIPSPRTDRRIVVTRQPLGVVAAITPWNFPAAMVTRKVAPALAAGCTVVVKPASATPFSALALGYLAEQAGVPPGVLNVVTGQAHTIGTALTQHPLVRKLSFTGSTAVGKQLYAECAPTVKRISLELGGNAPFLVFEDADIEAAVTGAMQSKYRNAGQTCVCTNRFLVQERVHAEFTQRLAAATQQLRVGPGLTCAEAEQGPLIDPAAVVRLEGMIADALQQGARVLTGGKRHALGGQFFEPTVLVDVQPTMRLAREEIFGPLAPIFRFRTEEEAIQMANDTEYGLAAYVYTRDVGRVWRVSEALDYGMVGVNVGLISTEVAPFGGMKASGFGREGSHHGIEEYLDVKYQCHGGLDT